MALLFIDGWDHYGTTSEKWDLTPGSTLAPKIVTSGGRFGGGYLEIQDNNTNEVVKFITPSDEVIVGIAFKFPGNNNWLIRFRDGNNTTIATHETEGTGGQMWRDLQDSGLDLGSYTSAFTTAVWQYLEVRVKVETGGGGNGEIEIRVNGVIVLSNTGISMGTEQIGQIFLRAEHQEANDCNLDDMYILNSVGTSNNTFLGDVRVTPLLAKANGNTNNFTPTGATNNFEAVDEVTHDQNTTFVEAGQLGAKEDYQNQDFVDVGFAPGTVFGVQVVNAALKTDAGQLKYKDQMVIAGALFDDGTEVSANSVDYKMSTFIRDTDPSDNATWTEAKVAAVGSGYEITFREI